MSSGDFSPSNKSAMLLRIKKVAGLDMKLYESPGDYLMAKGVLNQQQVDLIHNKFRNQNRLHKKNMIDFELAAYNHGFLSEDQLIDCIVNFRGMDVVRKEEMDAFIADFSMFSKSFCEKHKCFPYICRTNPEVCNVVVSFGAVEVETIIRRTAKQYLIRHTIPAFIDEKLEEVGQL